jgi:hypothetical protein
MNRLPLSSAAAALFRAILDRASLSRDRILLTHYRSVDWQSLTFVGERHEFGFRLPGPDADAVFARLTDGLGEAEFKLPRHVLADIVLSSKPVRSDDGSLSFGIEALTLQE